MRNYCIFCGNKLVGGSCRCAEFISYYGAAPTPVAPIAPVIPKKPGAKPADSHFQPASDL